MGASSETCLVFRETIPRSSNTKTLAIPDLTDRGLVLSGINFETNDWFFEASLKSASGELVGMRTSYFQHHQDIDLSGLRTKIDEGDRLDLVIKPKQAPRAIELMVCFTYVESNGSIYYQSQDTLTNLYESTILTDISQGNLPTCLEIKCENPISSVSLVPCFTGSTLSGQEQPSVEIDGQGNQRVLIDFTENQFKEIIPLLRFYQIKIEAPGESPDANLYFLARGFKN